MVSVQIQGPRVTVSPRKKRKTRMSCFQAWVGKDVETAASSLLALHHVLLLSPNNISV